MLDLCGRTLGEFFLHARIGGGGAGDVYRGEQRLLKRDVVVRVLHQRPTDAALQGFLAVAQFEHLYAAHVYDVGLDGETGLQWLATELVHGISLQQWLATHGPMPLDQFVPFFECLAQVVHAAHKRGIIHRALKPSSVMVIEGTGSLWPKLLDLGLDQLTRSDATMCSPAYRAPEQWANDVAVGQAADLYALGVVAYESLTGRTPFIAETLDEYRQQHRDAQAPPLGGDFSSDLDRILQRALAKSPENRHRSALELASELCAALRASPREQLRTSAHQWEALARPPGLLWGPDVLASAPRVTRAPSSKFSVLERSFIAACERRARRFRWFRRSLVVIAVAIVLLALEYWSATKAQTNEKLATQAEREQGRSALLHGEPEAGPHLARAYQRDHLSSTAFMLARALQPRLAEQARFASSSGRLWSAAFSPDSRQIITTDDKNAQVWDAQTHQLRFTLAHGDTVYHAVYSGDGTRIITAGGDGLVRVWDAARGSLVGELRWREGKPPRYVLVALSPDGRLVAAIDLLGEITHVWDAGTGVPLAELRTTPSRFASLAFSADGRWLAASGGDDVRVFDTSTWKQVLALAGPRIHSLAFDPTRPRLVTGSAGGDAAIWAIPGGERIHHLRDVGEAIDAVAFSPDGALAVTASQDGAEQIWDAASGALRSQLNPRHSPIASVEFDRTSKLVLSASTDGAVVIADAALGMPVTVLDGSANVMAAHFDPSSRQVVGASLNGSARVWEATAPYRRWSSPPISDDCGIGTSLEPDRRFVAVGCKDHNTRVWDTRHDQLLAELPGVAPVDGKWPPAFPAVSAAGDRAAIARGNVVEIYELPGSRLLRTISHGAAVRAVAFASTGHDLVSGSIDGALLVTRDERASIALPTSPEGIDVVGVLVDGRIVATAGKRLRIYDVDRDAVLADLEVPNRVMALRMSPDGRRLITLPYKTGTPVPPALWDLEHHRLVILLEEHVGRVFSARFMGTALITAGADRTVRLWDGATGRLRQTYRGDVSSRFFVDATLSPDGSMVVAGGGDGLLWFWDATDERPIWKLQAHRSDLVGLHFEGADIVTRGFAGDVSRWTLPDPQQTIKTCNARETCAIVPR